jgi:hypothetical protein
VDSTKPSDRASVPEERQRRKAYPAADGEYATGEGRTEDVRPRSSCRITETVGHWGGMQQPMPLSDAQRAALEQGEAVRVTDPATRLECVVVRADVYERVKAVLPDLDPQAAYPAADEAFREGWADQTMAEYDQYESRRP